MPPVASPEALLRAVAQFPLGCLDLAADAAALAAARQSLDASGLLLLGEVHGVRENPMLIRALMRALGVTSLALEWPDDLVPLIAGYLADGTFGDHPLLWSGDGRITAGHLALLAELAAAGSPHPILFDRAAPAWSARDEAMAASVLAGSPAGIRTLVVAGNAHTPTARTEFGVPLGAHLARRRPGVREVRVRYGEGAFYNFGSRRIAGSVRAGPARLTLRDSELLVCLPAPSEAAVPHRPASLPVWPGDAASPPGETPKNGRPGRA